MPQVWPLFFAMHYGLCCHICVFMGLIGVWGVFQNWKFLRNPKTVFRAMLFLKNYSSFFYFPMSCFVLELASCVHRQNFVELRSNRTFIAVFCFLSPGSLFLQLYAASYSWGFIMSNGDHSISWALY